MDSSAFSPRNRRAVEALVAHGVPVLTAPPIRPWKAGRPEFRFPRHWQNATPGHDAVDRWRPGWLLAAVCGLRFDVIDVDPRNGGQVTLRELESVLGALPPVMGKVRTPGGGHHLYVARSGLPSVSCGGIDYLASRRLVYLPGCSRPKYHGHGYRWMREINWARVSTETQRSADFVAALLDRRERHGANNCGARGRQEEPPLQFGADAPCSRPSKYFRSALLDEADEVAGERVNRNDRLNEAAFRIGQLVRTPAELTYATEILIDAADECGLIDDDGRAQCVATIESGLRSGRRSARPVPTER